MKILQNYIPCFNLKNTTLFCSLRAESPLKPQRIRVFLNLKFILIIIKLSLRTGTSSPRLLHRYIDLHLIIGRLHYLTTIATNKIHSLRLLARLENLAHGLAVVVLRGFDNLRQIFILQQGIASDVSNVVQLY